MKTQENGREKEESVVEKRTQPNLRLSEIQEGDVVLYRENRYSFYPVTVVAVNREHPCVIVSEEGHWMLLETVDLFDEQGMNEFICSGYDGTTLVRETTETKEGGRES